MANKPVYDDDIQVIIIINGVASKTLPMPPLSEDVIYIRDLKTFSIGHLYGEDDKPNGYNYLVQVSRRKTSEEEKASDTDLRERRLSMGTGSAKDS